VVGRQRRPVVAPAPKPFRHAMRPFIPHSGWQGRWFLGAHGFEDRSTDRSRCRIHRNAFDLCRAVGQQAPSSATAPLPLRSAKKVFVSNAGADSGLFPHPFSDRPDRAYNQFYAGLQRWDAYALVSDPQEADLIFELQLSAPGGPANPNKQKGASDPLPMFRMVIFDRRTHYVL
jgi:hypothetical protein